MASRILLMMPVSCEQSDPCEGTEQEAHAHGQHHQHIQELLSGLASVGDVVGHGVAQQQADEGRRHRVEDGLPQNSPVQVQTSEVHQAEFPP